EGSAAGKTRRTHCRRGGTATRRRSPTARRRRAGGRRRDIMTSVRRVIRTMCPMNCHPTLCGMLVEVEDGRVTRVTGDPDNPDSRGFLCVRGQAAPEILDNPRRLLYPMMRDTRRAPWRRVTWDEALDAIVARLRAAGREAVATWPGHGIFANNYGTRLRSHLPPRLSHLCGCRPASPPTIRWARCGVGL